MPGTLWNSTVTEVSEEEYVVRQDPFPGSILKTPFGPARITVTDDSLHTELLLEEGGHLVTQQGTGSVVSVNATKAVIDFNHPLAGQTIIFEIERVG